VNRVTLTPLTPRSPEQPDEGPLDQAPPHGQHPLSAPGGACLASAAAQERQRAPARAVRPASLHSIVLAVTLLGFSPLALTPHQASEKSPEQHNGDDDEQQRFDRNGAHGVQSRGLRASLILMRVQKLEKREPVSHPVPRVNSGEIKGPENQMADIVAASHVRALWAYSEVTSLAHGELYRGQGMPRIRWKARHDVPFDALTSSERSLLVTHFNYVRGGY
jgi:hypothetical protein